jgi:hypothetical protein
MNNDADEIALSVQQILSLSDEEMKGVEITLIDHGNEIGIEVEFPEGLKVQDCHRKALLRLMGVSSQHDAPPIEP